MGFYVRILIALMLTQRYKAYEIRHAVWSVAFILMNLNGTPLLDAIELLLNE